MDKKPIGRERNVGQGTGSIGRQGQGLGGLEGLFSSLGGYSGYGTNSSYGRTYAMYSFTDIYNQTYWTSPMK